jgi:tetratricopeptide (TPR) repeat protein
LANTLLIPLKGEKLNQLLHMQIKKISLFKSVDILSYVLMGLNLLAVPLVMAKNLSNAFVIPKVYIFAGLILLNLLLVAVKVAITKKFVFRQSFLDLPILVFLGTGFLSAIFSVNRYDSFFGRNEFFMLSFIFLLFLVLFYFVLINYLQTVKNWKWLLDGLIFLGGFSTLPFLLKSLVKIDIFNWLFKLPAWNTIDNVNSLFGLWLIVVFILSAGQVMRKNLVVWRLWLYSVISLLCLAVLLLLGFGNLWWLLLIATILLLFLGVGFVGEARLSALSILFVVLILTVVFIVFGSPKAWQTSVPAEVSLGLKPSLQITYQTLKSSVMNFIFGQGLGGFGVSFSQFRSADFNASDLVWSLRFRQPFGSIMGILSEGGILMFLSFIFLVLFYLGHTVHLWLKNRVKTSVKLKNTVEKVLSSDDPENIKLEIFLVSAAWLVLTLAAGVMFLGPTLWWLWWLLLGLGVSGLGFISKQATKLKEWVIIDSPQYNLAFSFVMIVIITVVIMLGIWGVRLYCAETAYTRALQSGSTDQAENNLQQALNYRNNYDLYHVALAQVYLSKAANLSRTNDPNNVSALSGLLAQAVNEAQKATELSPASVAIWENLATMYENAVLLVPEARDWAIKSLIKAAELEPTNPVLVWRLGNNYFLANKTDEAVKQYQKALELKPNYADAYNSLANLYEVGKKIPLAVKVYEQALTNRLNSPEIFFNYGRLLYNRAQNNDREFAEQLWLAAVQLQPNYSNALYSLGLLYEGRGDYDKALQYYQQVDKLNPGNQDVKSKISALQGS